MFVLSFFSPPPIFPFFLVLKITKDEVCFSISFISYFQKISKFSFFKNLVHYVCSYPCDFLGFGLYFSNLHINVYHVFDVDFE
jgi:hypothetical protein